MCQLCGGNVRVEVGFSYEQDVRMTGLRFICKSCGHVHSEDSITLPEARALNIRYLHPWRFMEIVP
jgi:hypothetical protein